MTPPPTAYMVVAALWIGLMVAIWRDDDGA